MIILGIDPGTRITGYGVLRFQGGAYTLLDYGCIRPPASMALHDRYVCIHKGVTELIQTYKPQALSVETQYVKNNPLSALKLGMARGTIIVAARLLGVEVFEYTPSQGKSAVTGSGKASKEQVQGMTQKILGLKAPPTPEDAADALALAIAHGNRQGSSRALHPG